MPKEKVKPQLHISMLDMISRCGKQFQRRYGARFGCWDKEEIVRPGIALLTGITVHKTVESDLNYKMNKEILLPLEHIQEIARDEFSILWEKGVGLNRDEARNAKATKGEAIDKTVALSTLHHNSLAPFIKPLGIEEKFVIDLVGYPYNLAGTIDVREKNAIRDTKTRAASPPEGAARTMQFAMYALAEKIKRGKLPKKVYLDCLVKTNTPKLVVREAVPTMQWIDPLLKRVENATEIIQAVKEGPGRFTPADPENWVCSEKYCGYARTCPYWSGK